MGAEQGTDVLTGPTPRTPQSGEESHLSGRISDAQVGTFSGPL